LTIASTDVVMSALSFMDADSRPDMHTALATPRALELAGVDGPRAFQDGSQVVCRAGWPTGELREIGAQRLVLSAAPAIGERELRSLRAAVLRRQNALGLTGGHVMDGARETFELLRELEAAGELTQRLRVALLQAPGTSADEIAAQLMLGDERGRLWRGGVAKFFADGVIDSGTAWLDEPDTQGAGTRPFWRPGAARARHRALRARRLPVRDARDRRPRGALHARRVRARRRGARRAPPAGAPRDAARRSRRGDPPPPASSPRCSRCTCATCAATAAGAGPGG